MKYIHQEINTIAGKTGIVRCNFDVPIEDGQVVDTTRIEDAVSTITLLRQQGKRLVILAHYDRPDGQPNPQKSLRPIVSVLEKLVGEKVTFIEYQSDYHQLVLDNNAGISLMENLRFWPQEEDNDSDFAKTLASLGEFFVNQAFANCHRAHASIVGIPPLLPSFAGVNLAREMEILAKIRNHPDTPLVVVIGGAKLETKEPLVSVFADKAEHILVGGKVGVDLKQKGTHLPANVMLADMTPDQKDITLESAQRFAQAITTAKTVIWNGTMGVFEQPEHQQGTRIVAQAVNDSPAFTLVGGGDTETALTELNLEHGIDFISSGGGAMLTYLSEGRLVGTDAL